MVARILDIRKRWTAVRAQIEYFEKTGTMPEQLPSPAPAMLAGTLANVAISTVGVPELKLEIARISTNISKTRKKLELSPDHKKATQWQEELSRFEAIKTELKNQIVELTYATAQQIP